MSTLGGEPPVLLVTGATGQLGPATVARLAARGDRLLLVGRDEARMAELDKEFGSPGVVETFTADVSDPLGARLAAAEARERMGSLDGLVHMVGAFHAGPSYLADLAEPDRLWRANFLSAVHTSLAVLAQAEGAARMVYFTTPLVHEPLPGLGFYAASKAALAAWMRSFSHEVKHRGVHANAVMMTMADTPDARRERPGADFGQAVTPELVARVVDFLTSEASDGLYGASVPVLGRFGFTTGLAGGPPAGGPSAERL
ncbi:SDR family oxidoreductase [Streptomyces coelicoflavus]|uniref:SDR family oxidoreductase n=1 Tax=Streptomyces coelicoflavus TaxID=285562 RepID=UPI0036A92A76